jgi:hypothetical protein
MEGEDRLKDIDLGRYEKLDVLGVMHVLCERALLRVALFLGLLPSRPRLLMHVVLCPYLTPFHLPSCPRGGYLWRSREGEGSRRQLRNSYQVAAARRLRKPAYFHVNVFEGPTAWNDDRLLKFLFDKRCR